MPYTRINFLNLPSTATPISAENLNAMQNQYDAAVNDLNPKITAKADKTYVDGQITAVNSTITPKADKTYVDGQVAQVRSEMATIGGSVQPNTAIGFYPGLMTCPPALGKLTIPTHVSPSGGEATHPSVVYFAEPWNGYNFWMAMTPYPGGNDAHEDPNIIASTNGTNWVVPSGLTNPLDNQPGSPGAYNSDTDLVFADGKLWCFWRTYTAGAGATSEQIWYRTSTNGTTWAPKVLAYQSDEATRRLVSPSLLFENGKWTMFAVDIKPSTNVIVKLTSTGALPNNGQWSAPTTCSVTSASGKNPWHLEVRRYGERLYMMLNDCNVGASGVDGDLYFCDSANNGLNWNRSSRVMTPRVNGSLHNKLYRGTFVPEVLNGKLGFRVWYAGLVDSSPSVWGIFRNFISADDLTQRGTYDLPLVASNAGPTFAVTFPQAFSGTPTVTLTAESGRLTLAATNVSRTGFTLIANNWTTASAQAGSCQWIAVGPLT